MVQAFKLAVDTVERDKLVRSGEEKIKVSLTNLDKRRILETFVENDEALG